MRLIDIKSYVGEILEHSPDMIIITDPKGTILSFSKGAEEMLGYKEEEVLEKNIEDLWERKYDRKKLIKTVERDGHVSDFEALLKTKDGKDLYISLTMSQLKDASGKIIGTLGISKNITSRKKLELEREVMMNIHKSLISRLDIRDVYSVIATEMNKLIKFDRMSIVLRNHRHVMQEKRDENEYNVLVNFAVREGTKSKLHEGSNFDLRGSMLEKIINTGWPIIVKDTKDGTFSTDHILSKEGIRSRLGYPIIFKGEVIGSINLGCKDVNSFTEEHYTILKEIAPDLAISIENTNLYVNIKEFNNKLLATNKELEDANRFKMKFLTIVSHDLRIPLYSILSVSTILINRMDGALTDEQEKQVKMIEKNGRNILALINNLLNLEKIKSGLVELFHSSFEMLDMISEIRFTIEPLLLEKQIGFDINVDKDIPSVYSDKDKLRQILLNLLGNAIKFTKNGGRVSFYCSLATSCDLEKHGLGVGKKDYEYFLVKVKDTGIGIAGEELQNIFDEFKQVSHSNHLRYSGTGLGLSITKKLVELLGGSISVKSTLGEGSTFLFTVPVERGLTDKERDNDLYVEPKMVDSTKRGILVVEDDDTSFSALKNFLEKEHCQVFRATNGLEAIEKANSIVPFAMTLDIMIPGKDGWEVMKTIKKDPKTADVPIIIVSILKNKKLGFTLGVTEYMVKPIDKERLLNWFSLIERKRSIGNVLLVDDDMEQIYALNKVLKNKGYRTLTARDGKEALDIIEKNKVDLITIDIMMPKMEGFHVLEELKERKEWRSIPVLIITAKELTQKEKILINGNVKLIFEKGIYELNEVLEEIDTIIDRRARERRKGEEVIGIEKRKKDRREPK